MLRSITLPEGTFWYAMSGMDAHDVALHEVFQQPKQRLSLSHNPRTRFYLSADRTRLFKFVLDKHRPVQFAHWLGRDMVDKRVRRQHDSRKEYDSNRILEREGHATVPTFGYGVALNPFNPLGSVHVMAWLPHCISGQEFHDSHTTAADHEWLATMLANSVSTLAQSGYYHDDLTLGNVMIDTQLMSFVWVDTRVKRLPKEESARKAWLIAQAEDTCLPEGLRERYRQQLIQKISFEAKLPSVA